MRKMVVLFLFIGLFMSCSKKKEAIEDSQKELCAKGINQFTSQVFNGTFYPCRTDGQDRQYSATATFQVIGNRLVMHLEVPDISVDTTVLYQYFCQYIHAEPMDVVKIVFMDSANTYPSDYNTQSNEVSAWFQFESTCEMAMFQKWRF